MSKVDSGYQLRKIRQEKALSLREVAAMAGINVTMLGKLERNERIPSEEIIAKLSKVYKYNAKELMALFHEENLISKKGESDLRPESLSVAEETVNYQPTKLRTKSEIIKAIKSVLKSDGRVSKAWILGSIARNEAGIDSDVDIMVTLNNKKKYSFFDLLDIAYLIEEKIKRKVDLVEKGYLKPFASQIAKKDLEKIYE